MLEAVPTDFLSRNFRLEQESKLVGQLDPSMWRCKATLDLEEGTYNLYREKLLGGDYLLEHNGTSVPRGQDQRLPFQVCGADRESRSRIQEAELDHS